jgi:4-hydroxy-3-polyprenylbenzoate decarboxylase
MDPVVVGISGGSGVVIAKEVINTLLEKNIPVIAICSDAGKQVWMQELNEPFSTSLSEWTNYKIFSHYGINQISAPIASGSFPTAGMLIIPSSMSTVASIAHGLSDNLIKRAADVTIKEKRPLIIMPRETPMSPIHLENLHRLSQVGAIIHMPAPAFYLNPKTVEDIVSYLAAKAISFIETKETNLEPEYQYMNPKDET